MEDTVKSPYQLISDPSAGIITRMKTFWQIQSYFMQTLMPRYQNNGFVWGQNDCHTLVLDVHDYLHNTAFAAEVRGKYTDALSARKFQAHWMDSVEWLEYAGYSQVDEFSNFCVISVKQHPHFLTGGFHFGGNVVFHSVVDSFEKPTLACVSTKEFENLQLVHSIWSK